MSKQITMPQAPGCVGMARDWNPQQGMRTIYNTERRPAYVERQCMTCKHLFYSCIADQEWCSDHCKWSEPVTHGGAK